MNNILWKTVCKIFPIMNSLCLFTVYKLCLFCCLTLTPLHDTTKPSHHLSWRFPKAPSMQVLLALLSHFFFLFVSFPELLFDQVFITFLSPLSNTDGNGQNDGHRSVHAPNTLPTFFSEHPVCSGSVSGTSVFSCSHNTTVLLWSLFVTSYTQEIVGIQS